MATSVISLYENLGRRFGDEAAFVKPPSRTRAFNLVASDGTPVTVGWFENTGKRGTPPGGRNNYALTGVPPQARTIHHRIMIEQLRDEPNKALLIEEDNTWYLEGLSATPELIDYREIAQPALAQLVETHANDCLVLRAEEAEAYERMAVTLTLDGLRRYGVQLREQQGVGLDYLHFPIS